MEDDDRAFVLDPFEVLPELLLVSAALRPVVVDCGSPVSAR
jgi:hypothetical protein